MFEDSFVVRRRNRLHLPTPLSLALSIGIALVLTAQAREPDAVPQKGDKAESAANDPEKLLESIDKLREARAPADATSEQEDAFEQKRFRAIVSDADLLLACELSPKQALKAVRAKVESLELLSQLGDERAPRESRQFLDNMEKDRYGKLPNVQRFLLDFRLISAIRSNDPKEQSEQAKQLWPKVQQTLTAGQPVESDYRLAALTGMLFEQTEQPQLAAETYQAFAKYFRTAHAAWADEVAKRLEGNARLLTLVGQPIKIEGTLSDGHRFDINSFQGRVVLVDFWATWCGPCVAELENLKRVYKQYHAKGLEIVGVNLDDSHETLQTFLKERPIPWSIIHDAPQAAAANGHPLAEFYGINSLPTLILTDRQGRVVSTHARGEKLEKLLAELLGPAE